MKNAVLIVGVGFYKLINHAQTYPFQNTDSF